MEVCIEIFKVRIKKNKYMVPQKNLTAFKNLIWEFFPMSEF